MKALTLALLMLIYSSAQLYAVETDSSAKQHFYKAKEHIEDMLSGKAPLSYERAIYEIENAWWGNTIDYTHYQAVLNYHTENIRRLIKVYRENTSSSQVIDLLHSKQTNEQNYDDAIGNYGIYTYMTSPTMSYRNGKIDYHLPYTYSSNDPLGTDDWTNTHITKLINEGSGNCFALASLFKIYSERLETNAKLCTAPGHIYIRHADEKGTNYNIELASHTFPGTGTIETITYTPTEATKQGIALRELNLKQSVALCLVYLAKGYEYKFGSTGDEFMLSCAGTALKHDSLNLNAMLLKAEVLESNLMAMSNNIEFLQKENGFKTYEDWITHIFNLGYREMPYEMKNTIIRGWKKDTLLQLQTKDHTPARMKNKNIKDTRYAGLSWGLFDEEIRTKPLEKYNRTVFNPKSKQIVDFVENDILYNQYNFDPVVFAWNVDPLAHEFPWQSPYAAMDNSPIWKNDPTGKSGEITINKQAGTVTVSMNIFLYGSKASPELAKTTARDIQNMYNSANATVKIGNETYKVQFDVKGGYLGNGGDIMREAKIAGKIFNNTDVKNNFFRVEEQGAGRDGVSNATHLGNDGTFNLSQITGGGSTTEAHEVGHGLGLSHNNASSWQSIISGVPDLMDNAGDIVSDKYKGSYGLKDGTLDVNKRRVSQKNVDGIFTPGVVNDLEKSGKTAVGTTTNTYYAPNGQSLNKQ